MLSVCGRLSSQNKQSDHLLPFKGQIYLRGQKVRQKRRALRCSRHKIQNACFSGVFQYNAWFDLSLLREDCIIYCLPFRKDTATDTKSLVRTSGCRASRPPTPRCPLGITYPRNLFWTPAGTKPLWVLFHWLEQEKKMPCFFDHIWIRKALLSNLESVTASRHPNQCCSALLNLSPST